MGVKPIEWRLLTNCHADTPEAALELIDWYRARWEIERLFLILKEACRVEALQLASMARIERALMVFLVVAWRIARLMRLGRSLPDLDAGLLLEPEEWQAAYILSKKPLPDKPPARPRQLDKAIRMDAIQADWLTQTKFISPRLRGDIVPRCRLLDALYTAIRHHALMLVSAPAGYGKTTLLTSLTATSPDVSVAWISLVEDDNDPTRFLAALALLYISGDF